MFPRETFIALRAQRQALKIARAVLLPRLDIEAPAAPPLPPVDREEVKRAVRRERARRAVFHEEERQRAQSRRASMSALASAVWIMLAAIGLALLLFGINSLMSH